MDRITYTTFGTCSKFIDIEIENGIINQVNFIGGCSGNTQGVGALIKGMHIKEAINRLQGIKCGNKNTSCPDQLAQALIGYLEKKDKENV
ncbi:MAG: TIGR03905 family TSCPD domain-containing protein [Bacteroidales bacterium]|nr:TIGR03905 family TSCPD domain-containing protein [Bacteroidales bacterium]